MSESEAPPMRPTRSSAETIDSSRADMFLSKDQNNYIKWIAEDAEVEELVVFRGTGVGTADGGAGLGTGDGGARVCACYGSGSLRSFILFKLVLVLATSFLRSLEEPSEQPWNIVPGAEGNWPHFGDDTAMAGKMEVLFANSGGICTTKCYSIYW
ncbi:GSCOCG00013690001-RA-CDS [Cotesia congregata]|nr:GSCOCG00013690001-RA-CDS [Cotesia congregata]